MKLSYRGQSYELTLAQYATRDSGLTACYRGSSYQIQHHEMSSQPMFEMQYRGIRYMTGASDRILPNGGTWNPAMA